MSMTPVRPQDCRWKYGCQVRITCVCGSSTLDPFGSMQLTGQSFGKDAKKLLNIDRLGQVVLCSHSHQSLDLAQRRVGADNHYRNAGCLGIGSEMLEHPVSIHVWKVKIQEDQIRPLLMCNL